MGELVNLAKQRLLGPLANVSRTSIPTPPVSGATVVYSSGGSLMAKPDVDTFRVWAQNSPWVWAAIWIRVDQISSADYEVGPFDIDRPYSKRLAKHIKSIFDFPNPVHRNFRNFITGVMFDLMSLDAGCFEIVGSVNEPVRYLYPVDPKWVRVSRDWDGMNPDEPRYYWFPGNQYFGANWKNQNLGYMMQHPSTFSPLGLSPLHVLQMTLASDFAASHYNRRLIESAVPDGLLHLGEGVPQDKVDAFRAFMAAEVLGKGAMAITGGGKEPKWMPFRQSNRDMQFKELMEFYVRQIAVVYRESVQDLGLLFDINRSTGETQAELSEDRGLRPLADLLQDELTQQVVWHPSFGGPDNNLAFKFSRLRIKESYERARTHDLSLARMPKMTVNEARVDDGREPIGDLNDKNNPYNQLLANTSQGLVRIPPDMDQIPTPAELGGMVGGQDKAEPQPEPQGPVVMPTPTEAVVRSMISKAVEEIPKLDTATQVEVFTRTATDLVQLNREQADASKAERAEMLAVLKEVTSNLAARSEQITSVEERDKLIASVRDGLSDLGGQIEKIAIPQVDQDALARAVSEAVKAIPAPQVHVPQAEAPTVNVQTVEFAEALNSLTAAIEVLSKPRKVTRDPKGHIIGTVLADEKDSQ